MEAVPRQVERPPVEGVAALPARLHAATPPLETEAKARPKVRAVEATHALLDHILPLFDLSYQRLSIERIFTVIQVVTTLGLLYGVTELSAYGFSLSIGRGLLHLFVLGPVLLFGGLAVLRAILILLRTLVRIADRIEDLGRIAHRMEDLGRVADNMEELGELPRWVRGLSPLRRLRTSAEVYRRGGAEGPVEPE